MGYLSLVVSSVVSSVAVAISMYTFLRKQKSEQFRIAIDIQNKLEEDVNQLIKAKDNPSDRRSYSLQYLNTLELLSLLINKGEIKNKNVIEFFKPRLTTETKGFLTSILT